MTETTTPLVVANMSMSLDGFVAHHDDTVDGLFDWYEAGDELVQGYGGHEFHVTAESATVLRDAFASVGAYVVGRRLYDITNGWNGRPPTKAPMFVVTHEPPADAPADGVPITFFAAGVEPAVRAAQAAAGDGVVAVAGAQMARACLDAGLLDEIVVNLIPIVLGDGIPFFAGAAGPVRLEDPEVVAAAGVTHLRYRVAPR